MISDIASPITARLFHRRGRARLDASRYEEARKDLTEALERDPGRIDIYFDLAWLLATCPDERVRDSVLAIRIAQRALELDAVNADFMEVMAAAHADLGDFDEAVRWRALALDAVIHAI